MSSETVYFHQASGSRRNLSRALSMLVVLAEIAASLLPIVDSGFASPGEELAPYLVTVAVLLLFCAFNCVVAYRTGALPGVGSFGVKAVRIEDGGPAEWAIVKKYVVEAFAGLFTLVVGLLVILRQTTDDLGRTWFDRMAGIIYVDANRPIGDEEAEDSQEYAPGVSQEYAPGGSEVEDPGFAPPPDGGEDAWREEPAWSAANASSAPSGSFGSGGEPDPRTPWRPAWSGSEPYGQPYGSPAPAAPSVPSAPVSGAASSPFAPVQYPSAPSSPSSANSEPTPAPSANAPWLPGAPAAREAYGGVQTYGGGIPRGAHSQTPVVRLVFDDGVSRELTGTLVVGRNPVLDPAHQGAELMPIADRQKSVSKTHAALTATPQGLLVEDLRSTNGTVVISADGNPVSVAPGFPIWATDGASVVFGGRRVKVVIR